MSATPLDLDALVLAKGDHEDRDDGVCLMEAVAWFAGEPHTDLPRCVSPVLVRAGTTLNDLSSDEERQLLKPLIPRLVGTSDDGQDQARIYLALDWVARTCAPAWLDLTGFATEAADLRALAPITDPYRARVAYHATQTGRGVAAAALARARPYRSHPHHTGPRQSWTASRRALTTSLSVAVSAEFKWAGGPSSRLPAVVESTWGSARYAARDAAWLALHLEAPGLANTRETLRVSVLDLFERMIDPAGASHSRPGQ